jgi:hypothetical protein
MDNRDSNDHGSSDRDSNEDKENKRPLSFPLTSVLLFRLSNQLVTINRHKTMMTSSTSSISQGRTIIATLLWATLLPKSSLHLG